MMGIKTYYILIFSLLWVGCAKVASQQPEKLPPSGCAPSSLQGGLGSAGEANIFRVDPVFASGNLYLSPQSSRMSEFLSSVTLQRLSGEGILKGTYVEVRNGLQCNGSFGAYAVDQKFLYPHEDFRFQESMSYFYADDYQSFLNGIGYLSTKDPIRIYAHCDLEDNAYFTWARDPETNQIFQLICLGDSVQSVGAFYSDDSQVIIHELQHASTGDQYSSEIDLNQFFYDEAGSMNEGLSDFMALAYTDSTFGSQLGMDARVFSRWALGRFFEGSDGSRGSHRCPSYDPHFPECASFPQFSMEPSLVSVSFVYPDGMGWPYHFDSSSQNPVVDAFKFFPYQEEIHNAGTILTGALWDAYSLIKQNHDDDAPLAFKLMSQLVLESLRHLPQPDDFLNHSPVTFIGLAQQMIKYAPYVSGFAQADQDSLSEAFRSRGLHLAPQIQDPQWLSVGSGTNFRMKTSKTPGLKVFDDPVVLKRWLIQQGSEPSVIRQDLSSALNSELDPGEVAMVWFDLKNESSLTAGGVLLTVTSLDPDVEIMDARFNIGYLSGSSENQTQVMYGKINGTAIVSQFNSGSSSGSIPTDRTYFTTNPYFNQSYRTGIWVRAKATLPHGKWVKFRVQATPANGVSSTQEFSLQVN